MTFIRTASIFGAFAISACAPLPSKIEPVQAQSDYSQLSCSAAKTRLTMEEAKLASLVAEQERSARNDAIAVAIVLVPVSAVSGKDRKDEIAVSKGEVVALKARVARCV